MIGKKANVFIFVFTKANASDKMIIAKANAFVHKYFEQTEQN